MTRILLALCLLLYVTACASNQIVYRQLIALNKGMSQGEVATSLQRAPLSVHEVQVDGMSYVFQRYAMYNGRYSDLFLLCYENGKLKYWGYVDEFRRHPDTRINRALEAVLPALQAGAS